MMKVPEHAIYVEAGNCNVEHLVSARLLAWEWGTSQAHLRNLLAELGVTPRPPGDAYVLQALERVPQLYDWRWDGKGSVAHAVRLPEPVLAVAACGAQMNGARGAEPRRERCGKCVAAVEEERSAPGRR